MAKGLALGLSIWPVAIGGERGMRGERKSDSTKAGRGNASLSFYVPAWAAGTHMWCICTETVYKIHSLPLYLFAKILLCHTFYGLYLQLHFYPWTLNERYSFHHATWGMRCVCIHVRICIRQATELAWFSGRLMGLVKMRVRKYRVTDVAFLLFHSNMVILPPPASLIFPIHIHICTQAQSL